MGCRSCGLEGTGAGFVSIGHCNWHCTLPCCICLYLNLFWLVLDLSQISPFFVEDIRMLGFTLIDVGMFSCYK